MAEQSKKQYSTSSNGQGKKADGKMNMLKSKAATTAMAGVAGAVVGAGVAVAATQILSDKQTRDKVKKTFDKVKTQVVETIKEEQQMMEASSVDSQKKIGNGQNKKSESSGSKKSESSSKQGMDSGVHAV